MKSGDSPLKINEEQKEMLEKNLLCQSDLTGIVFIIEKQKRYIQLWKAGM